MKLMILGASLGQVVAIQKAKALGYQVVTCDYYEDAMGHDYADERCIISTFDLDGVLNAGRKHKIDGIMTVGTDQPVYTAAYVAKRMKLPSMITEETALLATNKIPMKACLNQAKLPIVKYRLYEPSNPMTEEAIREFDSAVVIKPVDTQGQRGIFYLDDVKKTSAYYERVVHFSREKEILIEAYYKHDEITVSGWVQDGKAYILAVTDRVTFKDKNQIGICLSHEFPSKHLDQYKQRILTLTQEIVDAIKVKQGPIYFQMFVGDEGIKINEIACRIGGAFEGVYLPELTGVDICQMQIQRSLGLELNQGILDKLKNYELLENHGVLTVQLFFASPCKVAYLTEKETVLKMAGVMDMGYHIRVGDEIGDIENATARVGYCIVRGATKDELNQRLKAVYKDLVVKDQQGINHIIHRPLEEKDVKF